MTCLYTSFTRCKRCFEIPESRNWTYSPSSRLCCCARLDPRTTQSVKVLARFPFLTECKHELHVTFYEQAQQNIDDHVTKSWIKWFSVFFSNKTEVDLFDDDVTYQTGSGIRAMGCQSSDRKWHTSYGLSKFRQEVAYELWVMTSHIRQEVAYELWVVKVRRSVRQKQATCGRASQLRIYFTRGNLIIKIHFI